MSIVSQILYEGKISEAVTLIVIVSTFLYFLNLFKKDEKVPKIKKIPALDAIKEAIGRSVELGRPINMTPGFNYYKYGAHIAQQMAAYSILGYVAETCGKLGGELIVTVDMPYLLKTAEQIVREGYISSGNMDNFNPDNVMWVSDQHMPFAIGTIGIMEGRNVGANIFAGIFWKESLMLGETGSRIGAVQIAATTQQVEFFITTCDYVMIGEELYAAGALLSKDPNQITTVIASDYTKLMVIGVVILAVISSIANIDWLINLMKL